MKPASSFGIKAPKEGQGAGIPHVATGSVGKPRPPLELNRGEIMGLRGGGMVRRPAPRPAMSPIDLVRQKAQQQQQAQRTQPQPGPVNPFSGAMPGMRHGGMVPAYGAGGMMGAMGVARKPVMPGRATPMMPGAGSKSAPMGLRKGAMVGKKPKKAAKKKAASKKKGKR